MDVDIETVFDIFCCHEIKVMRDNKKTMQEFAENNPGVEIPEIIAEGFCLPTALKAMCKEIIEIKKKLEMK